MQVLLLTKMIPCFTYCGNVELHAVKQLVQFLNKPTVMKYDFQGEKCNVRVIID